MTDDHAEHLKAHMEGRYRRPTPEGTPPCGGPRCSFAMHDGQRIESHVFEPGEACADHTTERTGCTLHGGIHYRSPLVHSVILDISDPGLAGVE